MELDDDYNNIISTHALREEGDHCRISGNVRVHISTHALREEGDIAPIARFMGRSQFLPTPSARRATYDSADYGRDSIFLPTPSARRATDFAV